MREYSIEIETRITFDFKCSTMSVMKDLIMGIRDLMIEKAWSEKREDIE